MSDFKNDLRRYIDGLEEPVSVNETMSRRQERRYRVPAAVLAGAAVVLLPALVLVGIRWYPGGDDVAEPTTVPPAVTSSTESPETTSTTTPTSPAFEVPSLFGLTEEEARAVLEEIGLVLAVTDQHPGRFETTLITAQRPDAGEQVAVGTIVEVAVTTPAGCLNYNSTEEAPEGSIAVTVLFECAPERYPDVATAITRVVPATSNVIEATLNALLAGPTDTERAMGFSSFFSAESADALNSVTLDGGRLTVDFNDAILINNASTSTGGLFFGAELRANLFQFEAVQSIEFRLNGSCDAFSNWLQSTCQIMERAEWETAVAQWDAERDLQADPGERLTPDDVVGKTFTTELADGNQRILQVDGEQRTDSGFSETGGWQVPSTNSSSCCTWALRVTGLNTEMIWLVFSDNRSDTGRLIYEVRAALEIPWDEIMPVITSDPFVMDGSGNCTIDGENDPRLVVVAQIALEDDVVTGAMTPLRAWRIDAEQATFEEIPATGIECFAEFG